MVAFDGTLKLCKWVVWGKYYLFSVCQIQQKSPVNDTLRTSLTLIQRSTDKEGRLVRIFLLGFWSIEGKLIWSRNTRQIPIQALSQLPIEYTYLYNCGGELYGDTYPRIIEMSKRE